MADGGTPAEACCQACRLHAGKEPLPAPDAPAMRVRAERARIVVRSPDGAVREVRPTRNEVLFGRSKDADVVLAHPTIARRQLRLLFGDSGLEVEDLQSSCGTFVDEG